MAKQSRPKVTSYDLATVVLETMLGIWMRLYESSMETFRQDTEDPVSPELLREFQLEYAEAVEWLTRMHEETRGNLTLRQLYDALPNNFWLEWQHDILTRVVEERSQGMSPSESDITFDSDMIQDAARARKQRKDVM